MDGCQIRTRNPEKVVAYDDAGKPVAEKQVVTAGKPHHISLEADRKTISANGEDLCYVTATIVDKNATPAPQPPATS